MTNTISNSDDVIDSRDIIERIDELRSELDSLIESYQEAEEPDMQAATLSALADWLAIEEHARGDLASAIDSQTFKLKEWANSEEASELNDLEELAEEAEGYAADWKYGETLIRETYWVDYCQELCEDIGDIPKNIPHYIEIDWGKTAENIKADYTTVEYGNVTYLIRSC
jgi:hypothetical protein